MTTLDSFFTDRRQKEGKDTEDCLWNILDKDGCNDAYTIYERRIPVPANSSSIQNGMRPCITFNPREPEHSDMIDTLECNVDYSIMIGGIEYKNISRILTLCLAFHQPEVRIYLDQPNMPNEIVFSQRNHHFPTEMRRAIIAKMNPNGVLDGEIGYAYGMAGKSPEWAKAVAQEISKVQMADDDESESSLCTCIRLLMAVLLYPILRPLAWCEKKVEEWNDSEEG